MRSNAVEVALGDALEWGIQHWVAWSGSEARIAEAPWLEGPIGNKYIGAEFYEDYARDVGLHAVTDDADAGLLSSFDALAGRGSILLWFIPRFETSTSARHATISSRT